MDIFTALLIVFAIYILVYIIGQAVGVEKLKERGLEIGTPFFIMYKTERLNAFLTRVGKKFPRAFFNLGVVVAFGGMLFGFWLFTDNLLKFFIRPEAAGGVVPIIPGVTITGLPLVYMLIGIAITLLTHEFAHGLACSKDDIPIKSSGLIFFTLLFGGFVEPDEETFENEASPRDRMRMLAAGSFMNLIFAVIFMLVLANMTAVLSLGFNPPSGAYIYDIAPESPASEALSIGDVIVGLNDTEIETWNEVSFFMNNATSGSQLTIHTLDGSVTIILAESEANATRGYIGVYGADYWEPKVPFIDPMFAFHFQQTFVWGFVILLSIALFNLLPIPVFDGDKLLKNILTLITDDERKIAFVMWPARIASIVIVVLSVVLSLIMGKGLF